jgi:hypothetical protein
LSIERQERRRAHKDRGRRARNHRAGPPAPTGRVWFKRRHVSQSHYRTWGFCSGWEAIYFQVDKPCDWRTGPARIRPEAARGIVWWWLIELE